MSHEIAALLLNINAIQINPRQPFCFSSGIYSPVYCDNRLLISYPQHRQTVCQKFADLLETHRIAHDVIAGTATAGIPHAAWLAEKMQRPLIYVRSKAKAHGKHNQIEGHFKPNDSVVVIEDLVSSGGSVLNAVKAIRAQQGQVSECLSIVQYGFSHANTAFKQAQIQLHSLTDFETLLQIAIKQGKITLKDSKICRQWQQNPLEWNPTILPPL